MINIGRIGRGGRSLHIVLPAPICRSLKLHQGDHVLMALENGRVILRKIEQAEFMRYLSGKKPREATPPPTE